MVEKRTFSNISGESDADSNEFALKRKRRHIENAPVTDPVVVATAESLVTNTPDETNKDTSAELSHQKQRAILKIRIPREIFRRVFHKISDEEVCGTPISDRVDNITRTNVPGTTKAHIESPIFDRFKPLPPRPLEPIPTTTEKSSDPDPSFFNTVVDGLLDTKAYITVRQLLKLSPMIRKELINCLTHHYQRSRTKKFVVHSLSCESSVPCADILINSIGLKVLIDGGADCHLMSETTYFETMWFAVRGMCFRQDPSS